MKYKTLLKPLILATLLITTGCSANPFTKWKSDGAIQSIKAYIDDVCNKNSKNYIPVEDRISTWDIDGTGIVERNLTNNDLLPQDMIFEYTYTKYRSGDQDIKDTYEAYLAARSEYWKDETDSTNKALFRLSQVTYYNYLLNGLTKEQVITYFDDAMQNGNYTSSKKLNDISYKPMKEMYAYLKANQFQVYFISGSFRYALHALASYNFGDIDFAHCIGTDVSSSYTVEQGKPVVTFDTMGDPCINAEKVNRIVTEIGKTPVISFGNSTGDLQMFQYTLSNSKYKSLSVCINHDDDIREYKYNYDAVHQMCENIGALEVSMKNNFLTVF